MKVELTKNEARALLALITAMDDLDGAWPQIERALSSEGFSDPDETLSRLSDKLRNA